MDRSVWLIHDAQAEDNPIPTGCGFFRMVLVGQQLRAHGWKAHWQAGTPPPEAAQYRLIVAERLDRPQVLGTWRRLRASHILGYELDDNVWAVDPANASAHRVFSRHSVQDAVEACIQVCSVVTVSTEPLAEVVRQRTGHPNVLVCPNYIPESVLQIPRLHSDRVTVGWTGGASHTWDVALIATAVRKVLNQNPEVRLHVVGTDFRPTFGHANTRWTDWEPDPLSYYPNIAGFDIGLAPVVSSTFNESKSWLKPLEYAAMGIPCIASDFIPYQGFVRDGETGFLVKTAKQWRDRLRLLIADRDLRETMGAKARELARDYTIEGHWQQWDQAYSGVL